MIQIHSIQEKGRLVCRLSGDLTIYAAMEARQELESLLSQPLPIALDLGEVDELDTAGVQILLWLKRGVADRGGQVTLIHHSPAVIEAFDLLHVTGVFGDPILIGPA